MEQFTKKQVKFSNKHMSVAYFELGLKCLVSMHQSDDMEGLTEDEVHIISSVLDLKEKRVYDIMIALEDVFTLSIDTVLDKTLVNKVKGDRQPLYIQ